jgi:hypothetical protein
MAWPGHKAVRHRHQIYAPLRELPDRRMLLGQPCLVSLQTVKARRHFPDMEKLALSHLRIW